MTQEVSSQTPSGDTFDIKAAYLKFLEEDEAMTMPVAAIEALVTLLSVKPASTSSQLIQELAQATDTLKKSVPNAISLSAGCDLFTRFVVRNINMDGDWESCRQHLVTNGRIFVDRAKDSRNKIAEYGASFIRDDDVVLVHSFSRAVYSLLRRAAKQNLVRFRVIVTEAQPTCLGQKMARMLQQLSIPVTLVCDTAVGYIIQRVDKVIFGAEGVAESGGIINHVGTYQIAVLAKNANKPCYVAAESHKFVRLFPLAPDDLPTDHGFLSQVLPPGQREVSGASASASGDSVPSYQYQDFSGGPVDVAKSPNVDFTSHEYITALITDLGVLTASGVSEELIKMWYD